MLLVLYVSRAASTAENSRYMHPVDALTCACAKYVLDIFTIYSSDKKKKIDNIIEENVTSSLTNNDCNSSNYSLFKNQTQTRRSVGR